MSADSDYITAGDPMPVIGSLKHLSDHRVLVTWAEGPRAGLTEEVDLGGATVQYRAYASLRDAGFFATGELAEDGNVLRWESGNGQVEMPATLVEHFAMLGQFDHMSPEAFRAWMDRHSLSLDSAAEALGIARRLVAYYRSGEKEVPRTVALACTGYDAAIRPAA